MSVLHVKVKCVHFVSHEQAHIDDIFARASSLLSSLTTQFAALDILVPPNEYYRFFLVSTHIHILMIVPI